MMFWNTGLTVPLSMMRSRPAITLLNESLAPELAVTVMASPTAVAVADLDSGYLRNLTGALGLERNVAEQVVDDLGNYRTAGEGQP